MHRSSHRRAFTLIELLVVISIISMLSSIVLASLQGARDKAKVSRAVQFDSSMYQAFGADAAGIWNFDDGTASDMSGNNRNGTVFGTVSFVSGSANTFNGSGQAISIDGGSGKGIRFSPVPYGSGLTMSAWIKTSDQNAGSIISLRYQGGIVMSVSVGKLSTYWNSGKSSVTAVADNKWHHVVVSIDQTTSTGRMYIDGVLDQPEYSDSGSPAGVAAQYEYIGCDDNNAVGFAGCGTSGAQAFNGLIDNPRVYLRALKTAEVQKIYAEQLSRHLAVE